MFKLEVDSSFSAAHFLLHYQGKCESLHGHNWKVRVVVSGSNLNASGMVVDFSEIKNLLYAVLKDLDHKNLNDLKYFKNRSPSSEEIARYVFKQIHPGITGKGCVLSEVKVWETENSCALYTEQNNG